MNSCNAAHSAARNAAGTTTTWAPGPTLWLKPGWVKTLATTLAAALLLGPGASWAAADEPAAAPRTLRYAFRVAETGFDPARISDLYSRIITGHIFEALYFYDHLARPVKIKPLTALAMPEVSADFRRFTIRLRPGIHFSDDAAFKRAAAPAQGRELVAQDYVYAIKRFADPATQSPGWSTIEELGLVGLAAVRQQALTQRTPFDYDRELPGLRAIDRYTLQLEVTEPRPRLVESLADNGALGAVAREVVEFYGDKIMQHPVGTGAFRLGAWRRSSEIVLERNPAYRLRHYEDEAEPAPGDAEGQALLARFKGRRLPMVDRVVVAIIEEQQPRWLSFLNRQQDLIDRMPEEFANLAMPGGQLAPNLAKQGLRGFRTVGPEGVLTVYNMEDPVIGGYTPGKIALRRALNLAVDIPREIALARRGQAIPAQSPAVPHTTGYDPAYRSEMGEFSLAKARALLDLAGYVDRDGDGWREQPDGQPLLLVRRTMPDTFERQLDELWQKNMTAIGVRVKFSFAKWPENLKAMQAGKLQIWRVGSSASQLDGQGAFQRLHGPSAGSANLSRFRLPEYDVLYNRMSALPNGPERDALFLQAKRLSAVYAPYKQHVHRVYTDMTQPWLIGYRRPLFGNRWWHLVDIDNGLKPPS
ncbi:MAG: bicyclomycin resistance protein [Microbacteriaceae bacterium]|nr:bicyclomycin resistance protein [Burkholderiaceae bacterium]